MTTSGVAVIESWSVACGAAMIVVAAKAVLFAEVGSFADSTRTSPVIVPDFKAKGIGTAIVNVAVPGANELFVQIA